MPFFKRLIKWIFKIEPSLRILLPIIKHKSDSSMEFSVFWNKKFDVKSELVFIFLLFKKVSYCTLWIPNLVKFFFNKKIDSKSVKSPISALILELSIFSNFWLIIFKAFNQEILWKLFSLSFNNGYFKRWYFKLSRNILFYLISILFFDWFIKILFIIK